MVMLLCKFYWECFFLVLLSTLAKSQESNSFKVYTSYAVQFNSVYTLERAYSAKNDFLYLVFWFSSVQFSHSVVSTLCDSMNHSTPCLPVHHQLLEFTQTHVHRVDDAIQPSHPPLSPSPPALNLSQHWGLFQRVSSSHQVAKVLEFQLQHQSFQWTPRTDLLSDGLVGSPCSPRDS